MTVLFERYRIYRLSKQNTSFYEFNNMTFRL